MTSRDSRPTDGHSDLKDISVRGVHDPKPEAAEPQTLGSPVPENPDALYEPASRLTLEGDAYGALGNDHESAPSSGQGSTTAGQSPDLANDDPYGRDGQPDRHSDRKGPAGVIQSDEGLRELVCERLTHDRLVDFSNVSVEVSDGCVTLKGTIPDHRMYAMIEDLAGNCPDVKAVTNRIQVVSGGSGPGNAEH